MRIIPVLLLASASLLSACVTSDDAPALDDSEAAAFSYWPMGFARVSSSAGIVRRFNSSGGSVTASRSAPGEYHVTFAGLGTTSTAGGSRGNVQVVAEGSNTVSCMLLDWDVTATDVRAHVACNSDVSTRADTPFAVLYVRQLMPPTTNANPTRSAYVRVSSNGFNNASENFNSSGVPNTTARVSTGRATVTVPGVTTDNASIIVTAAEGIFAGGHVCSLVSFVGTTATIECRTRSGYLVNTAFSFLYSTSGPTPEQQGAHALFTGSGIDPARSAALGKVSWCSPATVSGTRSGSLASMVVNGDLGSHDGTPFVRASFVTPQGGAGFCKVESATATEGSPSTSTTTVRCYSPSGTIRTTPVFRFVHVTSDATGPC